MCGIFGSNDRERFTTLYELNKDRGSFAYGGMYLHEGQEPTVQVAEGDSFQFEGPGSDTSQYYLGHTQGPTSSQREFSRETSHPFNYQHWHVAHNGVLSNGNELAEKYKVDNPVDSAVIPKMLDMHEPDCRSEGDTIAAVCSELKGTFACWIHNDISGSTYLVRTGCTLFVHVVDNYTEFSSKHESGMLPVREGSVYKIDFVKNQIYEVSTFDSDSPFFIL